MITSALLSFSAVALGFAAAPSLAGDTQTVLSESWSFSHTCQEIADSVSTASAVYYDGSPEYQRDISHWVTSATQHAACSFEPGTAEDAGIALRILGQTKTPFAVKGGGHSTNPGFSSSLGVQIAMTRFSEVVYDSTIETVTAGAGLVWDDIYAALEPYGRNVVGGRLSGVGIAGYTLGGGYSWLTNQYGLTIDTVQMFELVMPSGIVTNVTESSNPDLFFALKGGGNNFGIITRFTYKTFPQTQIWGGTLFYNSSYLDQAVQATANFVENNKDPKAAIIMTYNYNQEPFAILWPFYDAPRQPDGIFDEFLAIPSRGKPSVRSFLSFVKSITRDEGNPPRGAFHAMSTTAIPMSFLESVVNQSKYWGERLSGSVASVSYGVQPFLPTLFDHNTTSTAYPPDRTRPFFPLSLFYSWASPEVDEIAYNAMQTSADTLREQFKHIDQHDSDRGHGADSTAVYPNYALYDTPLADMYGANLPRLRAIRAEVDPDNVMGLAGGFKF